MRTHLFAQLSVLLAAGALIQCRKEAEPQRAAAPAAASVTVPAPKPAPPETVPATAEVKPPPPEDVGEWADAYPYKFKVTGIRRCGESLTPGKVRVGATVAVYSKFDNLLVAPRDVKIEKDGVILDSEVHPKPSPGCAPLLEPKELDHDQTLSGVVIFEIPDETYARSATMVYQATRWGGAPRAEVKLPDCLDNCPETAFAKPKPKSKSQAKTAR